MILEDWAKGSFSFLLFISTMLCSGICLWGSLKWVHSCTLTHILSSYYQNGLSKYVNFIMSLSKLKPSQLWDKDRTCHEYKDIGDIDNITMKCEFPVLYMESCSPQIRNVYSFQRVLTHLHKLNFYSNSFLRKFIGYII